MINYKILLPVSVLLLCLFTPYVKAEMSSTNYKITSTVLSGGGGTMSSASYALMSTLGQPTPPGHTSSSSNRLDSGWLYTLLISSVGDVNGDGSVDLEDVIAALQVVTGQFPDPIVIKADANGDGKIGLIEALHILRKLGE